METFLEKEVSGIFLVTSRVDLVLLLAVFAWDMANTSPVKARDFPIRMDSWTFRWPSTGARIFPWVAKDSMPGRNNSIAGFH
jgi:hypothetical protein